MDLLYSTEQPGGSEGSYLLRCPGVGLWVTSLRGGWGTIRQAAASPRLTPQGFPHAAGAGHLPLFPASVGTVLPWVWGKSVWGVHTKKFHISWEPSLGATVHQCGKNRNNNDLTWPKREGISHTPWPSAPPLNPPPHCQASEGVAALAAQWGDTWSMKLTRNQKSTWLYYHILITPFGPINYGVHKSK